MWYYNHNHKYKCTMWKLLMKRQLNYENIFDMTYDRFYNIYQIIYRWLVMCWVVRILSCREYLLYAFHNWAETMFTFSVCVCETVNHKTLITQYCSWTLMLFHTYTTLHWINTHSLSLYLFFSSFFLFCLVVLLTSARFPENCCRFKK